MLDWESRFTLGLNAEKNTDYIEKWFKQKLHKIKFSTKNSKEANLYLPLEWSYGASKMCPVWKIVIHWNEKVGLF